MYFGLLSIPVSLHWQKSLRRVECLEEYSPLQNLDFERPGRGRAARQRRAKPQRAEMVYRPGISSIMYFRSWQKPPCRKARAGRMVALHYGGIGRFRQGKRASGFEAGGFIGRADSNA